MKRWALAVAAVVLGASGILQTPAHAQSSPGSSAVASAVLGGFEVVPTPAQTPSSPTASEVVVRERAEQPPTP